jgi:hypothetical protein
VRRRVSLVGGATVVVLGLGLAALAWWIDASPTAEPSQEQVVAALIADYERSRQATYAMEGVYVRTMADGRRLESAMIEVQRPPDRLHRRWGSAGGRFDGRTLNCSTDPNGRFDCAPGGPAPPWEEMVAREIERLRGYFEGDPLAPFQARLGEPGCYEIIRAAWFPNPGHGVPTVMCFDEATGALRHLALEHEGGATDVVEAVVVRAEVSDRDFRLSPDDAFAPVEGG